VSDELRVLDELERRLIAGCYGPAMATEDGRRRRRGRLWAPASTVARRARELAVPALALALTALVIVIAITAALHHRRPAPQQHPSRPQPSLPVVHNYAHAGLPSLPRGSVTYFTGHLGASSNSPNPHDTFALNTTQAGLLKPGEGSTRSTLTIKASGLKPAPPGNVYLVWLAPASYTTSSVVTPITVLPPYSLVGIIEPPISTDGELVARLPISVDVRQSSTRQFELLITVQRKRNAKTPGRAVLLGIIS
jgi:hypothetical protein